MLAQADARQSRDNYRRLEAVSSNSGGRAVSRQEVDDAKAQADVSDARVAVNRKALQLALIGPRQEDIAQAEAMLDGEGAQVALLKQELADAELRAPLDAVVRSRIAEPGDMASPQKTALTLAIIDPKWVRAYVSETELGRVQPGMRAAVEVDSFPGRRFQGWVGFISPEAEFTPKTVQTEELRSSLVYEIRVFVTDPGDVLRLGMPATVYLSPGNPKT
jgi:HlyD family secretion protein